MSASDTPSSAPPLIVLYDGSCGLCDSAVRFILARDPGRRFRFAPLRSEVSRELLARYGLKAEQMQSVVLIDGDRVFLRSSAVLRIAMELPEPWPLAGAAVFIPESLRDMVYDFIARHRKRWFAAPAACDALTAGQREQFLA